MEKKTGLINIGFSRRELRQLIVATNQAGDYLREQAAQTGMYVYTDLARVFSELTTKLDDVLKAQ